MHKMESSTQNQKNKKQAQDLDKIDEKLAKQGDADAQYNSANKGEDSVDNM